MSINHVDAINTSLCDILLYDGDFNLFFYVHILYLITDLFGIFYGFMSVQVWMYYCLYCCLPSKYLKVDIFGNCGSKTN